MDNINGKLDIYETESLNKVVKNNVDSVDELQKQFNAFMDQQFKKRQNADDASLSLTGFTNKQRYDIQMKELVKESAVLDISQDKIDNAKEWAIKSNISIMYPCNDIDELYNKFLDQHKDLRRMADWKAIELFGVDNETLYKMIKDDIADISIDKDDNIYSLGKKLVDLDGISSNVFTEQVKVNHQRKKILNRIHELCSKDEYKWEFMYSPYFHPKEINELSGYYSDEVEDCANDIFKEYVNYCYGYENNFNPVEWDNTVRRLSYKLEYSTDVNESNILKQSLIKIGWNPEVEYNANNILKAKNRLESIIKEDYKNVSVLNVQSQFDVFDEYRTVLESENKRIHPISIVLVKGNSKFSDAIAKVTNGPYSHSAICLDEDFNRLYSFNAKHYSNKDGGLSLESIRTYPKENNMAVFSFFVNDKSYKKINDTVQSILYDINKSRYSFINIITMPFNNINLNMNEKMICSQFVDKLLKLVDTDITNKDSSKVTPNYLYANCIKNSKIYKVYDGTVEAFDFDKATKFITALSKKSKPINENTTILYEYTVNQYEYPVISEARKLPLQIKDNGDVLLSNPLIDFEAEYSACHKVLLQYEKAGNAEAMKYELARLYYMNYIIEKRLYNNKFKKSNSANLKTRARILNDFNKYMKYVLEKEPDFNFSKYYEASPFYANTVEIKSGTIKGIKSLINCIL